LKAILPDTPISGRNIAGFVCPLAADLLPDLAELTVSVHIELTGGQARHFPAFSDTVTGEDIH